MPIFKHFSGLFWIFFGCSSSLYSNFIFFNTTLCFGNPAPNWAQTYAIPVCILTVKSSFLFVPPNKWVPPPNYSIKRGGTSMTDPWGGAALPERSPAGWICPCWTPRRLGGCWGTSMLPPTARFLIPVVPIKPKESSKSCEVLHVALWLCLAAE